MQVIQAKNVGQALPEGMRFLRDHGQRRGSRNGPVLVARGPVTTVYQKPCERVLFSASRDANPFFHLMEGLWMLSGRNDVAWISQFSSNIAQYSDSGETFHGAYGDRWINHFVKNVGDEDNPEYVPFNQLEEIASILRENPDDRRAILGMWNPEVDLGRKGKDIPCNTQIMFSVSDQGRLDMTVVNRSNDIIWGAYGANAVHFSMLQEWMAFAVGVPVGIYWQMSNNYHAYVEVFEKHSRVLTETTSWNDPYDDFGVVPYPMVSTPMVSWNEDLLMFMEEGPVPALADPFFRRIVCPMFLSWKQWKDKEKSLTDRCAGAWYELRNMPDNNDWKRAASEWIYRRSNK